MADLADFVTAQDPVLGRVRAELAAGRKRSHWMWFIFPQLAALGRSPMALQYGLTGQREAADYLAHPVLGSRLIEAAELVLASGERDPIQLMGPIDALKLRSSMTLFAALPEAPPVFAEVLESLYGGTRCPLTRDALA